MTLFYLPLTALDAMKKAKGRDATNVPHPLDITEPVIGGPKMPVNGNMAIPPDNSIQKLALCA